MHSTAPTALEQPTPPPAAKEMKRSLSLTGMVAMMANNITTDIAASGTISQISAGISETIASYSNSMFDAEQAYYQKYVAGVTDPSKLNEAITQYQQAILPMQNAQQQLSGIQTMWTNTMQSASTGMSTVTQAVTAALNNLFEVASLAV